MGHCGCFAEHEPLRLVAVTGGPGAGKTALLEMASRSLCRHIGVLPESASILFRGGFPRSTSPTVLCAVQRSIYHVQRQLEWIADEERQLAVALCDRGSIDGVAYWPGPPESYWQDLGSTRAEEIARYYAVLHLEPPTEEEGYEGTNHVRIETAKQAREVDLRIRDAWAGHPRRYFVSSDADFMLKMRRGLEQIVQLMPECCRHVTV
jgi:hypothetical protein